jgi:predicted PurR-regulated permease PerM
VAESDELRSGPGPSIGVDRLVQLGIVGFLFYQGFRVLAPFADLIVWSVILAVALGPLHARLMGRLGSSPTISALLLAGGVLLLLGVPSVMLGDALGSTVIEFAREVEDGQVNIPPPPDEVASWPFVGETVHRSWSQASENLDALLARFSQRLAKLGSVLVRSAGAVLIGLAQFAASIVIAGVLLANRRAGARLAEDLFRRLAPVSGDRLLLLSQQTIQSVAVGVLGVAVIQSTLAGIGLLVAGVPYAGVIALVCLVLGIMQLPVGVVLIPIVIFRVVQDPSTANVLLAAYMVFVGLVDNVLRPLLLGRGVEAPMLVLIVGALGGFAISGFIGLFAGAIILVLVNDLFLVWLRGPESVESLPDSVSSPPPAA